jgi:Ni/Co efflux regulator RcnB
MKKIVLAAAIAAVAFTTAPLSGAVTSAKAEDYGVRVDRDHDRDRDRDRHLSVGLGGVTIGEHRHCRTVVTKIERAGREIIKRERRCD